MNKKSLLPIFLTLSLTTYSFAATVKAPTIFSCPHSVEENYVALRNVSDGDWSRFPPYRMLATNTFGSVKTILGPHGDTIIVPANACDFPITLRNSGTYVVDGDLVFMGGNCKYCTSGIVVNHLQPGWPYRNLTCEIPSLQFFGACYHPGSDRADLTQGHCSPISNGWFNSAGVCTSDGR